MVLGITTGVNRPTFDDYRAKAKALGASEGKGEDAYVGLLIQIMEGAYHGAIDMDSRDKHGKGRDDAFIIVADYRDERNKASQFKGKSKTERKILSNGRKAGKLGVSTKWGQGQPLANVSDLMFRRSKAFALDAKNTDDAANTFLKYATAQNKSDTLIDGDALNGFCRKNVSPQRTNKAIIKATIKTLSKLDDSSQELKDGIEQLVKRVNAITLADVASKQANKAA